MTIRKIEVEFAIPVEVEPEEERLIAEVVERIARRNTPEGVVHWQSGSGSKPLFSASDAAFLGCDPAPEGERPPDGDEPGYDDGVLFFSTACRLILE